MMTAHHMIAFDHNDNENTDYHICKVYIYWTSKGDWDILAFWAIT